MNFENISTNEIMRVLSTGSLESLEPDYQEYYSMMELVRGLRAKMVHNNKIITKSGIIKLLKNTYKLSDWEARRLYSDAINFFYAQEHVKPEAFANLYADRLEKWADLAALNGRESDAGKLITQAANLRGCFKPKDNTIPEELLNPKTLTIYTTDISDVGVVEADRKELDEFIDSIPDIPVITRENVKMDAKIKKFNIIERMTHDIEEFTEETTED